MLKKFKMIPYLVAITFSFFLATVGAAEKGDEEGEDFKLMQRTHEKAIAPSQPPRARAKLVAQPNSPTLVVFSSIPVDDKSHNQLTRIYRALTPPYSSVEIVDVPREVFQDSAKLQQLFDDTFRDWPEHKRNISILFGGHGAFTGNEGAWNWLYGNGVVKKGEPVIGVDARTLAGALERSLKNTKITSNILIDA